MRIIICILMLLTEIGAFGAQDKEKQIEQAVMRQMALYPQSTLCDLYKSFFQDRFGPGHIINDTNSADKYLRSELNSQETFDGEIAEPTGYLHNFYRVNLSVIKDGLIDYDTFFNAFIKSVNSIQPITIEQWKVEWANINKVITRILPDLYNYQQDNAEIEALLKSGKYAIHHSKRFNDAYNVHYRIIDKVTFEEVILPIIRKDR